MSLRKALLMVVILLALGAYLYFVEFPQQEEEASKKKLFTFDKDAVTEVTLTYPDRVLQLKKGDDGEWRITQPVAVEADTTTVNNLVGAVADAEVTRILEDASQDLSLYGLNAPVVKVQVTLEDGKTLPLTSIGKDTPVGYSVYVQKEGEAKLFLTPQAFRLGMTKDVKELRDKTIIAFQSEQVKKVEIQRPENTIVLAKADGGWNLEKPVSGKADDTQVQTFLSNVQGLRAQDFIDQPELELKDYGLVPPQLKVSLTVGTDGAQQTVLLGGEKTEEKGGTQRYVKRGEKDTLFLVGDWVYRDLNKTVNDFRDKTVARFAPDQVAKVEVSRQDGAGFTLTRGADKKWSIDKTQEGTLKEASLSQLVTDLHELRGFEVAADDPQDLEPFGLKQPAVTFALYDEKGAKLAAVMAGQKAEGETKKSFAMAEGGSTVFSLRDYIFDRLNKTPADFWEKPAEKKAEGAPPPSSSTTESEAEGEEEGTE
jgi:Domain of unknown function (DUF4340)